MNRLHTLKQGLRVGLETTWILGKVIFPVTLIVTVLSYTPVIDWVVRWCTPVMSWIGLPGEASIPFVLANLLNLYAGIGAILTLDLTVKEVFILAVMMSFSHNLLIESAVAKKVGVSMTVAVAVRLGLAFVSAFLIHLIWQGGDQPARYGFIPAQAEAELTGWGAVVWAGLQTAGIGVLQLAAVVIPLMIMIEWLKAVNVLERFNVWMRPLTKLLGLSPNTSVTLGAGLVFGLAFGAGVIIQQFKEENISKKDMYLLFIFLVACHAVIEDTLIFVPLGIPVWPLLVARLVIAILLTMLIAFIWNRLERNKQLAYRTENEVQHDV
ncbi:putative membrane protein YvoD [Caldalkalibacillus thermarum]|uniref:nucleoside recognition domain-containing protein n=1 Tax=Caldalkalibacillus thermarum TaxID=296745 RepID=UPI00166EBB1D|nr:nucleoside recognition domain-containing protein [Caldalkalibacillus thermarum]GGK27275.1 putative membrane protein YvoD [Caldalkalibacillus thermarum]